MILQRKSSRHDKWGAVSAVPKCVNGRGHKPQNAAGSLKLLKTAPFFVQQLEQFRMKRVAIDEALAIVWITGVLWEASFFVSVVLEDGPDDAVTYSLLVG